MGDQRQKTFGAFRQFQPCAAALASTLNASFIVIRAAAPSFHASTQGDDASTKVLFSTTAPLPKERSPIL